MSKWRGGMRFKVSVIPLQLLLWLPLAAWQEQQKTCVASVVTSAAPSTNDVKILYLIIQ